MLYIKTETAHKRHPTPGAEHVRAEDAGLAPDTSLARTFENRWSGNGVFAGRDETDDDRRENYERLRRVFRNGLRNPAARAALREIRDKANDGVDVVLTVREFRKFDNSFRRLLVEVFHEVGVRDIQSPGAPRASEVRGMDPVTGKSQINTTLNYVMTGPDGRDVACETAIIGKISADDLSRILTSCERRGGESVFIPDAVGLPVPPSVRESGDPWARRLTTSSPASERPRETTPAEMVLLFENMAGKWTAYAEQIQSAPLVPREIDARGVAIDDETALALAKALNDWSPELEHAARAEGIDRVLLRMAQSAAELSALCVRVARDVASESSGLVGPTNKHLVADKLASLLVCALAARVDADDLERCVRKNAAEYAPDDD